MYSRLQLAKKYLHYYFTASNGKGHGIHSPFVFDFVTHVLNKKERFADFDDIEKIREELLHNNDVIEVEDFGAGSGVIRSNKRVVKNIARSSLKPKKYARLLAEIANYYKSEIIVELGTSFGITTLYLAKANPAATVYTLEGAKNIALIAQDNFEQSLLDINLLHGNFEETLPRLLSKINKVDFAFVDGNHRKAPTLQYFHWLLQKTGGRSVFVFDDIHWSSEMEEAWKEIQQHDAVTLTIDLFFTGIVFFNKDFKAKQHFIIRF